MTTTKKKSRKMDKKLFASKQSWEVRTVIKRFPSIPKEEILKIAKKAGRSRVKLYEALALYLQKQISG